MPQKYDVAIIGSGLGGLFSALILAKEGKKVAVIKIANLEGTYRHFLAILFFLIQEYII